MQLRGNLALLAAAMIWGTAFVAQLVGMEEIGPFTYCMSRYILGVAAVYLVWLFTNKKRKEEKQSGTHVSGWKYGFLAGGVMFLGTTFQQVSMLYTTAGKAAFLTCLYIIFVPLFAVFLKKKIRRENWLGAMCAMVGLYCLCIKEDLAFNIGDMYAFICSLFWTIQILIIDRYAPRADCIELALGQMIVCAVLSTVSALGLEDVQLVPILNSWFPIAYAGIMSSGVAFTLQIVGQKYAEPAHAAVIMSMESVFGALSGWAILGERMTIVELFGCCMMMAGMMITQYNIIFAKKISKK